MWLEWLFRSTVYPKKYGHGFCFAVLCCGYTLTDFPISIRLTSLALWQSNDCPSASKATLMNMDKYFMRIHYERLHNHNKAKHNKTVCIFLGIYSTWMLVFYMLCNASILETVMIRVQRSNSPSSHCLFNVHYKSRSTHMTCGFVVFVRWLIIFIHVIQIHFPGTDAIVLLCQGS